MSRNAPFVSASSARAWHGSPATTVSTDRQASARPAIGRATVALALADHLLRHHAQNRTLRPARSGFATEGSRAHAASNLVGELIDGACDGSDYGAVAGAVPVRGEIALSTGKGL